MLDLENYDDWGQVAIFDRRRDHVRTNPKPTALYSTDEAMIFAFVRKYISSRTN